MKTARKWAFSALLLFVLCLAFEYGVRIFVLPGRLDYIESSYLRFPHHWLVESYSSGAVTIHEGRRVTRPHGRSGGVAFVGDSVTFGSALTDEDTFVAQFAEEQDLYDAVNLGVPGYGILECVEVVSGLPEGEFDYVVYTIHMNDAWVATARPVSLLARKAETIVLYNRYEGTLSGNVKAFLYVHAKSLYLILSRARDLWSRGAAGGGEAPAGATPGTDEQASETTLCQEEIDRLAGMRTFAKAYLLQERIYSDPEAMERLRQALRRMKRAAEAAGARLVVNIHYGYLHLNRGADPYRESLRAILETEGIEYLDLYDLHRENHRRCGYFADPGHPGVVQSEVIGRRLAERLAQQQPGP